MKFKKVLSRVAGHPADEVRVLPAPTQEKEEDLTNSIKKIEKSLQYFSMQFETASPFTLNAEVFSSHKQLAVLATLCGRWQKKAGSYLLVETTTAIYHDTFGAGDNGVTYKDNTACICELPPDSQRWR